MSFLSDSCYNFDKQNNQYNQNQRTDDLLSVAHYKTGAVSIFRQYGTRPLPFSQAVIGRSVKQEIDQCHQI